jgi:4-oxalomesaconate tautomerase
MQTAVPCLFMRGGTSRGPFFREDDLPADVATRDRVLLAVMGSPDKREIDGLGGATPLTSKVGIVRRSAEHGVDLEFLFAQVMVDRPVVDTTPNCGNMLAAVVPFALEAGLVQARGEHSTFRVLTRNTGMQSDITVQTPGGKVEYAGDARVDGVPGTAAAIRINFLDTAGSVCASMLPTGRPRENVQVSGNFGALDVEVTCIDNGMPMVLMLAADLGCSGYETVAELNDNAELKKRLEALRLECGRRMGLNDVTDKTYPKMCLLAAPRQPGGSASTRCFIPHVCHDAIGVLAAVTVATACALDDTVARSIARVPEGRFKSISVEHPSGEFTVELELDATDPQKVRRAALLRTARLLMRGEVMIPQQLWQPGHETASPDQTLQRDGSHCP